MKCEHHHNQGYLAVTLLITETDDLVRLVINSMRKDLEDHNEIHNCLALQAIADLGGKEVAESLVADVYKLLVSGYVCMGVITYLIECSSSINFVRKKAALCLLRLYRRHPDVVPIGDWSEKIIEILDDYDLGVSCSLISLISTLAVQNLELFQPSLPKAINKLHKVLLFYVYEAYFEDPGGARIHP